MRKRLAMGKVEEDAGKRHPLGQGHVFGGGFQVRIKSLQLGVSHAHHDSTWSPCFGWHLGSRSCCHEQSGALDNTECLLL